MPSRRQLIFGAFFRTEHASPDAGAAPLPSTVPQVLVFAEHCLAKQNVVCRSCGEACETQAIRFSPRLGGAALPRLDAARCTGCGDCLPICPNSALSLISATASKKNPEEFAA